MYLCRSGRGPKRDDESDAVSPVVHDIEPRHRTYHAGAEEFGILLGVAGLREYGVKSARAIVGVIAGIDLYLDHNGRKMDVYFLILWSSCAFHLWYFPGSSSTMESWDSQEWHRL